MMMLINIAVGIATFIDIIRNRSPMNMFVIGLISMAYPNLMPIKVKMPSMMFNTAIAISVLTMPIFLEKKLIALKAILSLQIRY